MKGKIVLGKEAVQALLRSFGCQILEPISVNANNQVMGDIAEAFKEECNLYNHAQCVYFIHPNGKRYCLRCDAIDSHAEFIVIEIESGLVCQLQHVL